MAEVHDCPLCGEAMRLNVREVRDSIPGGGPVSMRVAREWICPECDYFEEAEPGEEYARISGRPA
jgi:C4-type Zn-finger protein